MVLLSVACLTGILFGLRYKFVALVPVTAAAVLAQLITDLFDGQAISSTLLDVVLVTFVLQSGYVIGVISCDLFSQLASRSMAAIYKRG